MLENVPVRRYQTVDEVLKDLKPQSSVASTPATSIVTPAVINKSPSQIDLELEELKTQFTGGSKAQNKNIPTQPPPTKSQPTSEIDKELEELKAKYMDGK
jgi:hypothetical protein